MIYHLVKPETWEKYLQNMQKNFSVPSLKTEGFIHCSESHQLLESANRHFPDSDELVVLCLVEKRVKHFLKREHSRNGDLFPHLYGTIPPGAIETTETLIRNQQGSFEPEGWKLN